MGFWILGYKVQAQLEGECAVPTDDTIDHDHIVSTRLHIHAQGPDWCLQMMLRGAKGRRFGVWLNCRYINTSCLQLIDGT